jgi:uncharacterized coiled-coil DUF342 family protein
LEKEIAGQEVKQEKVQESSQVDAAESSPQALQEESKPKDARPRTQKEQELDALIAARQAIIEQLKVKNAEVKEARKELSALLPSLRGKEAGNLLRLMKEEEEIEFAIATEAYTPHKEKELLKRLREVRLELSKSKELEEMRKAVAEKRNAIRMLVSEIRSLEQKLAEARKACDEKYAEVLAERRLARKRLKERGAAGKKSRQQGKDISKYFKKFDNTVSMDEIVEIEHKGKKENAEEKEQ